MCTSLIYFLVWIRASEYFFILFTTNMQIILTFIYCYFIVVFNLTYYTQLCCFSAAAELVDVVQIIVTLKGHDITKAKIN